MSSFKRTAKVSSTADTQSLSAQAVDDTVGDYVSVTGVKPWVNTGLGIVSSGNKQLDELIGGGCALGMLTFVESDSFSNYGETLALYSLAESISHKHSVLLVSEDSTESERMMTALPYNQTIGRAGNASVEDHTVVAESTDSNKLTIAWQYGKYIKAKGQLGTCAVCPQTFTFNSFKPYLSPYLLILTLQTSRLRPEVAPMRFLLLLTAAATISPGGTHCIFRCN